MSRIISQQYKSPVGELTLGSFKDKLVLCDWTYRTQNKHIKERLCSYFNVDIAIGSSSIIELTKRQLNEYFAKQRMSFSIPLQFSGSSFQQAVWNELLDIPYGCTRTYLQVSRALGKEKAIRAVARANGANAIAIITPCHRVIGSKGQLVGYAGGLPAKKKLLQLEGSLRQQEIDYKGL